MYSNPVQQDNFNEKTPINNQVPFHLIPTRLPPIENAPAIRNLKPTLCPLISHARVQIHTPRPVSRSQLLESSSSKRHLTPPPPNPNEPPSHEPNILDSTNERKPKKAAKNPETLIQLSPLPYISQHNFPSSTKTSPVLPPQYHHRHAAVEHQRV